MRITPEHREWWCHTIFLLGLASLVLWLSYRTSKPKCYLQYIYLPALDKSLNSQHNATLFFTLGLENSYMKRAIYYDDLNVTFCDGSNRSHVVGSAVIPRFYQDSGWTVTKNGNVMIDEAAIIRAVPDNGKAVVAVELVTAVRSDIFRASKTKGKMMKVGADVEVNNQGVKANKKKIRLKSESAMKNMRNLLVAAEVLTNIFVLSFLD